MDLIEAYRFKDYLENRKQALYAIWHSIAQRAKRIPKPTDFVAEWSEPSDEEGGDQLLKDMRAVMIGGGSVRWHSQT